jgi:hypothetical protein
MIPDRDQLRKRALAAVGRFHSGHSDTSEKHDEVLAGKKADTGAFPLYITLHSKHGAQNMTLAETIVDHIYKMPRPEQAEVLDFIEYLETKARQRRAREEEEAWSAFSLENAMHGIAEEASNYGTKDLKETF